MLYQEAQDGDGGEDARGGRPDGPVLGQLQMTGGERMHLDCRDGRRRPCLLCLGREWI